MISRRSNRVFECIMLDINTQVDFCSDNGAHPADNHETLITALRRVVAWTKRNGVPVVSSVESHRRNDLQSTRQAPCCVDGSHGQSKIPFTIFPCSARIEVDNTLNVPLNLFAIFQQILFRVRDDDLLANPKADRFLTQLPVRELIVFGNILERSIKTLVLGLLARHKPVSVLVDACGYWDKSVSELALRQMAAKGARVLTVEDLLRRRISCRVRYPRLDTTGKQVNRNGNGRRPTNLPPAVSDMPSRLSAAARKHRMQQKSGRVRPHGS